MEESPSFRRFPGPTMSPVEKTLLWGFGKVAGRNRFLVALLWGARGLPKARPTSVTEEAVDKDCKLGNSGQIEVVEFLTISTASFRGWGAGIKL